MLAADQPALERVPMKTSANRYLPLLLVALFGCKEGPSSGPDAGPSGLEGHWVGVQSTRPGGSGHAAEVLFEASGDNLVGMLAVSDSADAQGVALHGYFIRYGPSAFKKVVTFLPDAGPKESYPLTVTLSGPNHFDAVEQTVRIDGGPFPIYYRFDRK